MFNNTFIKILIIIVFCLVLCYISKKIISKFLYIKSGKIPENRQKSVINLISNIVRIFIIFITLTIILEEIGIDTKSFIASLGVFSLVVGLALQDLLKDFIAGFSIVVEGLFNIGDWIEINSFKGEVIACSLRTTRIRAYTGEIKIISNRNIGDLINYSMDDSISLIDVEIAYEENLEKIDSVIDKICDEFKNEKYVKHIESLGLNTIASNGLEFRLIVKTKYANSMVVSRKLKRKIIDTFEQNNISIPYQQVVIHNAKL